MPVTRTGVRGRTPLFHAFFISVALFVASWGKLAYGTALEDGVTLFNSVLGAFTNSTSLAQEWSSRSSDPCLGGWPYITCDANGTAVTGLDLSDLRVGGTLHPDTGALASLRFLRLRNNGLAGTLPGRLLQLEHLEELDVSYNDFNGTLQAELQPNLTILNMANNRLSGVVPPQLGNLTRLSTLMLANNSLSGAIPPSLARFSCASFEGNPALDLSQNCIPTRKMATGTKVSALPAVVGGLLAGLVVVCACTLVAMLVARNRRARNLLRLQEQKIASTQRAPAHGELGQLLRFSSADIAHAKQRKGNAVIGEGGFGIVYHGRLPSGADVAIKALKPRASEAVAEVTSFQTEVELISRAVHANLLRLIGFCAEDNERALVYPYMPNQSVASKLRDRNGSGLTWATRMRIARGAAEGLAYMHYDCSPRIIHRDVKADNVLLDSEFNAVLGDFGLARMIPEKHTHVTSVVKGSFGYIPLEYLMTGKLTDKTDVFGFGMFLMELLTGAPANKLELRAESEEMTSVSDWVMIHFQVGTMAKVLDPRLVAGGGYDEAEVNRVVQVAILCMQKSPAGRPTMKECLSFFNGKGLDDRWRAWLLIESVQVHVDAYASNADGTRSRWDPSRNNVQVSQAVDDNGLDDVTPPAALGHVV